MTLTATFAEHPATIAAVIALDERQSGSNLDVNVIEESTEITIVTGCAQDVMFVVGALAGAGHDGLISVTRT